MTSPTTSYLRPLAALVAMVAAIAALLIAYNASPARAAGVCSTNAGVTNCTYASTGAEGTFEVPPGVSSVHVEAIGAPGAVGPGGSPAGSGARVIGDLTGLTTGKTLYVEVGGAPTGGNTSNCWVANDCIGGFNGGGSSFYGGGGGGASDVRTQPRTVPLTASDDSRLIVAAGGGGAGADGAYCQSGEILGGTGGHAGLPGGDGTSCPIVDGGTGGQEGTQSAGGLGGSPGGQDGSLGLGGGTDEGGGGGGGYYGGGGGGNTVLDGDTGQEAAAGGGGGGSSLDPDGGPVPTIVEDAPSITISYTVPKPTKKDDCKKGGFKKFGFLDQGTCITAFNENR